MSGPVTATVAVPPVAGLMVGRRELARMTETLLEALGLPDGAVDVRLAGDAEVAGLNRAFRGLPGPTNVLSFPSEDAQEEGELGQIVVSRDAVLREARLYGQDPGEHLVRLLAHGLLHLAGVEHGPDMEARTDAAVERVASLSL